MSVRLRGIRKSYGPTPVVRDLDLDVDEGSITCLLGPSGCGKTTTLRIVAGLERADAGEVWIGGEDVTALPPEKRGLGMVFQAYAVWPHMSVLENVAWPLRLKGRSDAEDAAKAALAMVKLGGLEGRAPHQLSGGQQQRVALARALAARPRVLLLDEPLSNLDAGLRVELREQIRALAKDLGLTTILVTHDQEEALATADRIAVMEKGVVAQQAPPEELYHQPQSRFVARFVGPFNEIPAVRHGAGVAVAGHRIPAEPSAEAPAEGVCTLGFRPEQARLGENGIPATVIARSFQGARVRYRVEGEGWTAEVDGPEGVLPRESVHLEVLGGRIYRP